MSERGLWSMTASGGAAEIDRPGYLATDAGNLTNGEAGFQPGPLIAIRRLAICSRSAGAAVTATERLIAGTL
jgi:hypothetical protein